MKVLIIGAGGQDGQYLAAACVKRGWDVTGFGRTDSVEGTILILEYIRVTKPDYVFHLAAASTASHDYAVENHSTIGTTTLAILEQVRVDSPKTKVFLAGSAKQFFNLGVPIRERDPLVNDSVYACTRNYTLSLARYYRTLGLKVYFGFLFHHESPLRKAHHVSRVVADAAKRAGNGETFTLPFGGLDTVREWTFAGDTVEAMLTLVQQDEIFEANIGVGVGWSISEWAEFCFWKTGRLDWRNYIVDNPEFKSGYDRLVCDPTVIKSLGWKPKMGIEELAQLMMKP